MKHLPPASCAGDSHALHVGLPSGPAVHAVQYGGHCGHDAPFSKKNPP